MSIVYTKNFFFIHPVRYSIKHIINLPITGDSNIIIRSLLSTIRFPVEIILACIDQDILIILIVHPVTILQIF